MDLDKLSFNIIYFKSINHYAANLKFNGQRVGLIYKHDGESLATYQMYDQFGVELINALNTQLSEKDCVVKLNYQALTKYLEALFE